MAELKQISVPDIGNFKDVSVIEVLVKVGDTVNAEDSLISLETDKAAMDVPSPYSGVIKEIKIKAGDKVSQGSVILLLDSSDAAPTVQPVAVAPALSPSPKGGSGCICDNTAYCSSSIGSGNTNICP